jgi:hypothetical protein
MHCLALLCFFKLGKELRECELLTKKGINCTIQPRGLMHPDGTSGKCS